MNSFLLPRRKRRKREWNPFLFSLVWNVGVFLALLGLALASMWVLAELGW
jgi:hypothetical protein